MSSIDERLMKMREERAAKQKARIEKLREINLKKYSKLGNPATNIASTSSSNQTLKPVKSNVSVTSKNNNQLNYVQSNQNAPNTKKYLINQAGKTITNSNINTTKGTANDAKGVQSTSKIVNNLNATENKVNGTENELMKDEVAQNEHRDIKKDKPIQGIMKQNMKQAIKKDKPSQLAPKEKETQHFNKASFEPKGTQSVKKENTAQKGTQIAKRNNVTQKIAVRTNVKIDGLAKQASKDLNTRKSMAFPSHKTNKVSFARKSMLPTMNNQESVFDRLYKPKPALKKELNDVQKLKSDPNYLKKVMKDAGMIVNKRHTLMDIKAKASNPVRRSISAVHFKRISKSELENCIHKCASIGDMSNKVHLENISEDNLVKEDKVVLAVKSEHKKVKFQTPCHNFNTPRPQELQARLKSWLQKRGKALDSYHHLQCFGLNHLIVKPLNLEVTINGDGKVGDEISENDKVMNFDGEDENKENVALESDSDDESYSENMNNVPSTRNCPLKPDTPLPARGWRRASQANESVDFNDTMNTTLTSADTANDVDEILLGALNDLTELLKEGFEWEQCARWLRAIRERFPHAPSTAAYWECRAQLEERRGDLPASVQCWEEALVKGTQHSVVEASLDQLLDKFMQLKISPNSGKRRQVDPKMLDVKNVFKSTIIRFAVQQAKIRQSEGPKYTVTPVRRSARLSSHWSGKRTPLQACTSVRQADEFVGQKLLFVPNDTLYETP
ncbi:hypothetical protein K1T71_000952 [Dendrolimus kikuchii]|uniref:Uncharacterized protein n=1 Tax=Dendrolimus kikuchii TaxID=765133 RepID=A0ACC1DGJ4_9NEOP|nr:hypothetical protein K1T71_000952 [Dendrolimus kikuchii]